VLAATAVIDFCKNSFVNQGTSYRELIDTLVQFQAACNGDGITGRDEEGHCDRYFIKVVDEDRSYQIEAKEYE
jgi:hypothetical protein